MAIRDIGYNDNNSLLCLTTNEEDCCGLNNNTQNMHHENIGWFLAARTGADGNRKIDGESTEGYQSSRGTGVIRLYRTHPRTEPEISGLGTGLFYCNILDATEHMIRTQYVNICKLKEIIYYVCIYNIIIA